MNDFTKEELENIYYDLYGDDAPCRVGKNLLNKIQSVIDNYCEHNLAIYIGPNGTKVSCQTCKKEFQ